MDMMGQMCKLLHLMGMRKDVLDERLLDEIERILASLAGLRVNYREEFARSRHKLRELEDEIRVLECLSKEPKQ